MDNDELQKVFQSAVQHHQTGQAQLADQLYRKIISANPNHIGALHLLGVLHYQTGKSEQGLDFIEKALEIEPGLLDAHVNKGKILKSLGCMEEAKKSFQTAIQLKPNLVEGYVNLGLICKNLGLLEDASNYYKKAVELKPEVPGLHFNFGNSLRELGELDKSLVEYRKAVSIDPTMAAAQLNIGLILSEMGSPHEAVANFNKALELKPDFAEALNGLGSTYLKIKRYDDAIDHCKEAIRINPEYANAYNNLATAYQESGIFDDALVAMKKALNIKPQSADFQNNFGNILREQNQIIEAADYFRQAVVLKPDFAEAHYNLGNVLKKIGQLDEAATHYQKAIDIKPDYVEAHNNLGNTLQTLGQLDKAVTHYQKVIDIKSDYVEAFINLGSALQELGQLDEAVTHYQKAIDIKPDHADAHYNIGNVQRELGQLSEAVTHLYHSIDLKPNYFEAHNNLGIALQELGQLDEAIAHYDKSINIKKDFQTYSNLLLALNYHSELSEEAVFTKHLEWEKEFGKPELARAPVSGDIRKNPRLRIGYLSPDFRTHSVAYFFEPLLVSHNRHVVEVYCYYNHKTFDSTSQRLKDASDHWRSIINLSDEEVACQIRQDHIDILVDLAGHTAKNRLPVFTYKPAPIQVTWLGYPNTTGLSSMDYRFTDDVADPVGEADQWYTEELIRLPNGFLCYQGDDQIDFESTLPCSKRGYVTFGSFNNLTKVTPGVVKLWSKILKASPESHLLIKSKRLADEVFKLKFVELFEKEGINKERLELYAFLPKKDDHLALYSKIDIGLDPFPYNGATTTCEALWMGVPTVTLAGDRHAGRVGASIMNHVGLSGFVAKDLKSYVEIAVKYTNDLKQLATIRQDLRTKMKASKLCDVASFASDIEATFKKIWEENSN